MNNENASNPTTVNIQDFHQSTVNIGSNVDTERVMAKLMEIQHMMGGARIGTIRDDDLTMTSSAEGIPSSETSTSRAEREENEINIKRMKEVFDYDDKMPSLLQSDQRNKILQIVKQKIDLGKDLLYAKELVLFITTSMQANSFEDVVRVRKELFQLLNTKINIPGRAVESLADEFRSEEKFFEAILLYLLALGFHANEADGINSVQGMISCCAGMWLVAKELIQKKSVSKVVVKQQIVPLFSEVRGKIQGMENAPEEMKIECEAGCMLYVANIHGLLEEYESEGESCKVGVEMMESKLPSSYMKHRVYGWLLYSLGASYFNRQRPDDAERCWIQAAAAYNTAEDFESEDYRKKLSKDLKELLVFLPLMK